MRADRGAAAWRSRVHVALAALVLIAADAGKPLVVDDTIYVALARQILARPLDPYGFEFHWDQDPEPAFELRAAPLLPYWIAGSMALFGDDPVRWKLGLLPFALALAASLWRIAARFACGLEAPLLWMAVLSPSLLPFLNLMLDVPAIALALLAFALFLAACERGSYGWAALAGLVGALAMQTKYSAAAAVAAMLTYGALFARLRHAFAAGAVAAAIFWGWEGLMALRYGQSHFLAGAVGIPSQLRGEFPLTTFTWSLGFLMLVGALAPAVGVLGLAALGARPSRVGAAALAVAASFAAIPLLPAGEFPEPRLWPRLGEVHAEELLLAGLGLATAAPILAIAARALRRGGAPEDRFLAAWLAIEVATCAAVSPFLAARRVIGVSLAALLLCGRAVRDRFDPEAARRALRVPLALGAALGALFAASDFADAVATRDGVRLASRRIDERDARPGRVVWYIGHWGFQFYAERHGMRAVAPGESRLHRGDWLVTPTGVLRQSIRAPGASPRLETIEVRSASPWSTNPWAYMGPVPIHARSALQLRVTIQRVVLGFVPRR